MSPTSAPRSWGARGGSSAIGPTVWDYNTKNQLTQVSGTNKVFYYDPLGRLDGIMQSASVGETGFQYDGDHISTEVSAASGFPVVRRYVWGPGADEPLVWYEGSGTADKRYLVADERGSVVAVTDSGGNPLAINSYDEYGIPASTNLGRFQYTGQAWIPELGMYHYKARTYSPTLGRFMQTDPIGYGDGINWYNYVGGDPVNKADPSGLCGEQGNPCPLPPVTIESDIVVTGKRDSGGGVNIVGTIVGAAKLVNKGLCSVGIKIFGGCKKKKASPVAAAAAAATPQMEPFHYRVQDFAFCSADSLFSEFRQPGGSAPGAPYAREDTHGSVPLALNNFITQNVDVGSRTITNVTEEGHFFYHGSVVIKITATSYGSAVTIEGRGANPTLFNTVLNRVSGAAMFTGLAAKATISCTAEAIR